jgi:hypothetical protein
MAKLVPPNWCSNAIPTERGWEDPDTGELYVSGGFSLEQLQDHNDEVDMLVNARLAGADVQSLTEAPVGNKSLDEMTKVELEALGRTHGVELDRRRSKETLVDQVEEVLDLSKMSKIRLEQLGRQHGLELDRRLTKDKLIAQLNEYLS